MDQELKAYLDGKFAAMDGKFTAMDGTFAAMDGKFAAMDGKFAAIDDKFAEMHVRIMTEVRAGIEKSENNLLRAFHGWARSMEIRVRGVSSVATGFEERLAFVEERISEVERRQAS
jgi:hypothetical protein